MSVVVWLDAFLSQNYANINKARDRKVPCLLARCLLGSVERLTPLAAAQVRAVLTLARPRLP